MIDPELDRLLRELDGARRAAIARADAALRGEVPPRPAPAAPPRTVPVASEPAPAAAAPPPTAIPAPSPPPRPLGALIQPIPLPDPEPASEPTPAAPSRAARDGSGPLAGVARTVAALVLTATAVLGGWLLVLEPALGSRPVLVRDESMSPSLRTGDVALAVAPDGPLGAGAIVAVRIDGRRVVTRVIDREAVPSDAGDEARAAAGLVVRADGEPLEVSTVIPLDDVIGEVGAAVPRVGLPLVLLLDPSRAPLGTGVVVVLLGLTVAGVRDLVRERRRGGQ